MKSCFKLFSQQISYNGNLVHARPSLETFFFQDLGKKIIHNKIFERILQGEHFLQGSFEIPILNRNPYLTFKGTFDKVMHQKIMKFVFQKSA